MNGALLFVTIVLAVTACTKPYASEIAVGMTTDQVIKRVGEPVEVLPFTVGLEFWRYDDDNAVLISNGQVVGVGLMTDKDYARTIQEMKQPQAPVEQDSSKVE